MAKNETYNRLIHTTRWLKLRRDTLTAHPFCQRCLEEGTTTIATEVHHVVPVETETTEARMARLMYDPTNLRALCHACHLKTHMEMGRCGKEATKRRNAAQVAAMVNKFFG